MISLEAVLVSMLAGALIGLEREHTKKQHKVGLRTFSLISLLGYVTSVFQDDPWLLGIGFSVSCAFAVLLYCQREKKPSTGFTTSISIVLAFMIGTIIGHGMMKEAVCISVIITVLLYAGRKLHQFIEKLTEQEVQDFLELVILLGLVYPLLPEQIAVQGLVINLKLLWTLVMVLVGLNFGLFLGARFVSARKEIPLVVMVSDSSQSPGIMSTLYKEDKKCFPVLKASFHLLLAGPFIRNFALAVLFMPSMLPKAVLLVAVSFLVFYSSYRLSGSRGMKKTKLRLKSPFNVLEAVKTGVVIFFVIWLLSFLNYTSTGVMAAAALGGFANGAATTISILASGVSESQAFMAVTLASTTSTVTAVVLLYVLGAGEIVRKNLRYLPELLVPLALALVIQ